MHAWWRWLSVILLALVAGLYIATFPPLMPSYARVVAGWHPSEAWLYVANDPVNGTDPTGTEGVVDGVIDWGTMVVNDLRELGSDIASGDFQHAFGGMPPTLGGGIGGTLSTATTGARLVAGEAAVTRAAASELRNAASVTSRTTRAGERAIRVESAAGRVKDISPTRVKVSQPVTHPSAPRGTMQRVKVENPQPGTKGLKRDPSPVEQRMLKLPEKPGVVCRATGFFCN